jgi:hypothetical protein
MWRLGGGPESGNVVDEKCKLPRLIGDPRLPGRYAGEATLFWMIQNSSRVSGARRGMDSGPRQAGPRGSRWKLLRAIRGRERKTEETLAGPRLRTLSVSCCGPSSFRLQENDNVLSRAGEGGFLLRSCNRQAKRAALRWVRPSIRLQHLGTSKAG